ncbi:hypothetical protein N7491_009016 [Penicillium cf. griseofulvum]|uniref:Secreted protein n=1 Tax=Penicillium cf. griseofulvum TaxID=2972120 RepID=A0A9W9MFK0_9EURO|nr:hypothetical protein N7472_005388 [Penicillium cf. griseofulvum]KAJ5423800.1 hypothetical protein N7491_009016 [Penicillium cf. griseofulvum]KAJ5430947.1 hypothetical protein N7445_008679 [Penicillium cf. griseofulvum]
MRHQFLCCAPPFLIWWLLGINGKKSGGHGGGLGVFTDFGDQSVRITDQRRSSQAINNVIEPRCNEDNL